LQGFLLHEQFVIE
jgi:hypothetical protein